VLWRGGLRVQEALALGELQEIIATVHARRAPMMSATAGLRL
jgi:hypothetical protein